MSAISTKNYGMNVAELINRIKEHDILTYLHSTRVGDASYELAKLQGLSERMCDKARCAGYLHDIGKIKVPEYLLDPDYIYTKEDMEKMKAHPLLSYAILEEAGCYDKDILMGVMQHHETIDGKGYPLKSKADSIGIISLILGAVDKVDAAMTRHSGHGIRSFTNAINDVCCNNGNQIKKEYLAIILKNRMIFEPIFTRYDLVEFPAFIEYEVC